MPVASDGRSHRPFVAMALPDASDDRPRRSSVAMVPTGRRDGRQVTPLVCCVGTGQTRRTAAPPLVRRDGIDRFPERSNEGAARPPRSDTYLPTLYIYKEQIIMFVCSLLFLDMVMCSLCNMMSTRATSTPGDLRRFISFFWLRHMNNIYIRSCYSSIFSARQPLFQRCCADA